MANDRAIIHSYGGGVQSAAIAVLAVQGTLPRPDRIVMADTGREQSATWTYLHEHIQPFLRGYGMEVVIAPHSLATVDLFPASGNGRPLIPMFTVDGAKLPTFCSVEWKRRVVGRWLRGQEYGPERPVTEWLGISRDEIERAKPSQLKWIEHAFPLLELNLSRAECVSLVERAGLPTPPRSTCSMCPHHTDAQWLQLKNDDPEGFELAARVEDEVQCTHPDLFLHRSGARLRTVVFRHETQRDLFDVCEEGRCEM